MVFARDLENGREGRGVCIDPVSYPVGNLEVIGQYSLHYRIPHSWRPTDMLVDQHDADVLPLGGEALKCSFNGSIVRLCVHYQKVLLRVWRGRDMLVRRGATWVRTKEPSSMRLKGGASLSQALKLTPMPARSKPVTES